MRTHTYLNDDEDTITISSQVSHTVGPQFLPRTPLTKSNVQSEKLQSLITAAKVDGVEPIWTTIFAKVRLHPRLSPAGRA